MPKTMLLVALLAGLATAQSVSAPPLATANSHDGTLQGCPFSHSFGHFHMG